jgi:hypothetical protein
MNLPDMLFTTRGSGFPIRMKIQMMWLEGRRLHFFGAMVAYRSFSLEVQVTYSLPLPSNHMIASKELVRVLGSHESVILYVMQF